MRPRRLHVGVAVTAAALGTSLAAVPTTATAGERSTHARQTDARHTFLVLAEKSVSRADTVRAIKDAGGRVTSVNTAIGLYQVTTRTTGFARTVSRSTAVKGAARNRVIGTLPDTLVKTQRVEKENRGASRTTTADVGPAAAATEGMDPLDDKLWGLRMVHSDTARQVNAGDRRVLVGVLDSGIDFRQPDLAGQVNGDLSRNFVTDIPEIDGPCEFSGCQDPVGWDDSGHGTHVAGTIAAAANGFGLSGVAPDVTLVEIRGGQDSGFLFLKPVTDALTYAGNAGLDVVNMSFYVDPWLYNCHGGAPEDSRQEAADQRVVIDAMNRAMDYAHDHGVTLVGSLGNNHEDLSNLRVDTSSPDYPLGTAHPRTVTDDKCVDLPVEGQHVIGVSALGPSEYKADYSNYSTGGSEGPEAKGEIEVSAPGGWFRDGFGTPTFRTNENLILSTYPVNALQAEGEVTKNGKITKQGQADGVIEVCPTTDTPYAQCGWYAWLQGTSMASPHVTGVAALAVSAFGSTDTAGGFGLAPDEVRAIVLNSAADHACPEPVLTYSDEGRDSSYDAPCVGGPDFNSIYGDGIVDAFTAVTNGAGS
jgi:lantibiotic leader peptide-processing serine protease